MVRLKPDAFIDLIELIFVILNVDSIVHNNRFTIYTKKNGRRIKIAIQKAWFHPYQDNYTVYTAKLSLKQSMLKIAIKRISGINQKHQKNAETEWGDKNGTTKKFTIQNTLKNIEKQIVCV